MIVISASELKSCLSIPACIDAIEDLYRHEYKAIFEQPARTLTRINESSIIFTMPAYSKKLGKFAVKIVSEFRGNTLSRKPVQGGSVVLIDASDGSTLATIDAPALTAIRTGAVSGLATRILAPKESKNVAVLGSGQQAKAQLEAIQAVRDIQSAFVYSPNYAHARNFAKEMRSMLHIDVTALKERTGFRSLSVDIIIAATNSAIPVIAWEEDVSENCHINSIGTLPERRELDRMTICNSSIFVDSKESVLHEAGDIMDAIKNHVISEQNILGDLGDLLHRNWSKRREKVTLFKSVGFGLQDVYAASKAYEHFTSK
ncbi:MAG: ornithine cyclodeaminase family protein [Nitrososphaerales archaeon]